MKLQTIVDIPKMPFVLGYRSYGLFVGSCFAENLESQLRKSLANVELCRYGQLYNPLSIRTYFSNVFSKKIFTDADVVKGPDGLWYSWDCHGSVFTETKDTLLTIMNYSDNDISKVDYVVITLGTSWVYKLHNGKIVANCHKMPSNMFVRRSMDVDEIVSAIIEIVDMFSEKVQFILTVSPIRHIKDGLSENSLSKAKLRVASDIVEKAKSNVYYYPAYEMMMDELRDYRFYKEDMLHPTDQATEYIMDSFIDNAFDEQSKEFFSQVLSLRQAYEHRPLHGLTPAYKQFRKTIVRRVDELKQKYPNVDFDEFSFNEFM